MRGAVVFPAEFMPGRTDRPAREPLPTQEQLAMIFDRPALFDMREEICKRIVKIETDLEFGPGDDEWAARARSALAYHRYAERLINLRIRALKPATKNGSMTRPRENCSDLGMELVEGRFAVDLDACHTLGEIEDALADLEERLEALKADRLDETTYPTGEQDVAWLLRSKRAIKLANVDAVELRERVAKIKGADKRAAKIAETITRERLFVEAAQALLDRDTYLRVWDRAHQSFAYDAAPTPSPQASPARSPTSSEEG